MAGRSPGDTIWLATAAGAAAAVATAAIGYYALYNSKDSNPYLDSSPAPQPGGPGGPTEHKTEDAGPSQQQAVLSDPASCKGKAEQQQSAAVQEQEQHLTACAPGDEEEATNAPPTAVAADTPAATDQVTAGRAAAAAGAAASRVGTSALSEDAVYAAASSSPPEDAGQPQQPQQQQWQQQQQQEQRRPVAEQQQMPNLKPVPHAAAAPTTTSESISFNSTRQTFRLASTPCDSSAKGNTDPDSATAQDIAPGSSLDMSVHEQQQQQQQQVATPKRCSPPILAMAPTDRSLSTANSGPITPLSSTSSGLLSPRTSGGVSSLHQRRSFNTAVQQPSLDSTIASASVARSLQEQYHTESSDDLKQPPQQQQPSLPAACALLVQQHCKQLQAVSGETTVLDIGCATGGSSFELALSFSHVLGIDSSAKHIVAAREMQEKGRLVYHPLQQQQQQQQEMDQCSSGGSSSREQVQQDVTCIAVLPFQVDKERVRFWKYPLPELPPKLQPVDAVLVEDVGCRLGPEGLQRVLAQMPLLLKPGGVCVVVLPGTVVEHVNGSDTVQPQCTAGNQTTMMADVCSWLNEAGLLFVKEEQLQFPVFGYSIVCNKQAHAGIWIQPSL